MTSTENIVRILKMPTISLIGVSRETGIQRRRLDRIIDGTGAPITVSEAEALGRAIGEIAGTESGDGP